MESRILPYLQSRFPLGDLIRVRVLKSCALGESHVDHLIHDLFESSRNPSIAVLAHPGQVDIRLTAKGSGEEEVEGMLDALEKRVRERLGAAIFGVGQDTAEEAVGRLMIESGKTVAILETVTGGALAARLTGIAGGAPFFKGGWVASSPDAVAALLGREGPVEISAGAAEELAHAVRKIASADIGLAVFGPIPIGEELAASSAEATHTILVTGDESAPPVSARRHFGGGGRFLQDRAAIMALDVLRRSLLGVEQLDG